MNILRVLIQKDLIWTLAILSIDMKGKPTLQTNPSLTLLFHTDFTTKKIASVLLSLRFIRSQTMVYVK